MTTPVRAASMSKLVTTVAALALVEQGALTLHTRVAELVPDYSAIRRLAGFDGDTPILVEVEEPATVRHLLTHTSGHGYWFSNERLNRYGRVAALPDVMAGRLDALQAPVVAEPGSRWEYGILAVLSRFEAEIYAHLGT
jgi:methyl acetate hydrolase